jgi:hypothetical protein
LAVVLVLTGAGALAGEWSPDLRALIENFQAHRRVAIGYLRTQNGDLGAVEIERLRQAWSADRRGLSRANAADAALRSALSRTEGMVAESLRAADAGDLEQSRRLMEEAGRPLDAWRKDQGIRMFSDCIAEVTVAYERLDRHRVNRPDLADPSTAEVVRRASEGTIAALDACAREAPRELRGEPEFRRLLDGMRASLRQVPEALAVRDGARLQRLLVELRSFERLLSFRFG